MNGPLHDSFHNWDGLYAHRNVELVRRFARVPRRPDVRVSPADLNYDVPPDADLRQFAAEQNIDVDAPWFRLPEQRRLRCGFFPLVTRLHTGALLAMWREASAHAYCSFGRTAAARSLDGGRSWSAPWVVDFRRPGAWDTGGPENLVQTGDGTLWLGAWARIPEPEPGTVGKQRPEMYVLRSHDEGRSWEQLPKLGDGFQFLCSPMLELSNGEFLWLGSVPDVADEGVTSYTALRRAVFILRQPGDPLTPGADLVEMDGLRFERYGAMQLGGTNECHVTETTNPGHLVMLTRSAVSEHYEQSTLDRLRAHLVAAAPLRSVAHADRQPAAAGHPRRRHPGRGPRRARQRPQPGGALIRRRRDLGLRPPPGGAGRSGVLPQGLLLPAARGGGRR